MNFVDMLVYCQKHKIRRVHNDVLQILHEQNIMMERIPWLKQPPTRDIVDCIGNICSLIDDMQPPFYIKHQITACYCDKKQYTKGLIFINKTMKLIIKMHGCSLNFPDSHMYKYIHRFKTLQRFAEAIINIQRRKRQYKKLIPEVIRLNRVLCFDVVFLIKDFLI